MEVIKLNNENFRNTITHLQLVDKDDINKKYHKIY